MSDSKWSLNFLSKGKRKVAVKIKMNEWQKEMESSGDDTGGGGGGQVNQKIVDRDLAKTFKSLGLKNIKVPDALPAVATLTIDGPGADKFLTDPGIQQEVRDLANKEIDGFAEQFSKLLKTADEGTLTTEMQGFVDKTIKLQVADLSRNVSEKLSVLILTRLKQIPQFKKEVKKWKVKIGLKIGLSSFVIVGSAVFTGLTWGAAAPAAVVGIARSCVSLGESIFKLGSDLDTVGKLVKGQLAALEKILAKDAKGMNTVKEISIGVASGILGTTMLPTVKNCTEHVETYDMKLKELFIDRDKMSPQVYRMMDSLAVLENQKLPDDEKAKKVATAFIKAAQAGFEQLLVSLETIGSSIEKGEANLEEWEAALKARPVAEWSKYVATAVGALTDLGLAAGGGSDEALNAALGAIISLEGSLADQMLERV